MSLNHQLSLTTRNHITTDDFPLVILRPSILRIRLPRYDLTVRCDRWKQVALLHNQQFLPASNLQVSLERFPKDFHLRRQLCFQLRLCGGVVFWFRPVCRQSRRLGRRAGKRTLGILATPQNPRPRTLRASLRG